MSGEHFSDVSTLQGRSAWRVGISIVFANCSLSSLVGPVLGGIFTGTLGWRSIFWFLVIACFVALVAIMMSVLYKHA